MSPLQGNLVFERGGVLLLEDGKTALQLELTIGSTDFIDYIFLFSDQGAFLRDPIIQQFAPQVLGSQPGVQLLVYNPVETLQFPIPSTGNVLVNLPQLANSTVPLSGFWAMLTIQNTANGLPFQLFNHPNIQIVNDRTVMFAQLPSVLKTEIDISHINIIINIFGVYVRDGLQMFSGTFKVTTAVSGQFSIINFGIPILEQ